MYRKYIYLNIVGMGILISLLLHSCGPKRSFSTQEIVIAWSEMGLYITQFTPANSPTYASRGVGYLGLTMYESVVEGFPDYQSIAPQLNGLGELPKPEQKIDWEISFSSGQAEILRSIYNQTSDQNKAKIDSLEKLIYDYRRSQLEDKSIAEASLAYGKDIARRIFEWSKTDGGHRAYLRNFDKSFKHPVHPGQWKPPLYAQSFSHNPLHPYWGKNRTFLKENSGLEIPYMIPYDTTEGSEYYKQFIAVYEKDLELTQKEKEIAIWWGDDPDDTFTPPGHSFYIANLVVKAKEPSLIQSAETFAKVGIAVADAFINCWKWKYHYFSERPNTFIPEYIDRNWESFWPDPPFPAFPSGHAIQAAASSRVLEEIYGETFSFIDSSHVGRKRDEVRDVDFVERPFETFWGVAIETADSRFFGGIHTPQDNEVGLLEGTRIAKHVSELKWKK
ncbi:MAG: vanadium-dependent haloperoxidase [Bacteroidota bacterium]